MTRTQVPGTTPAPAVRRRKPLRDSAWWALLFVGPTALGLAAFYFWPLLRTGYMSLTTTGAFGGETWVGLANFAQLFNSPDLLRAAGNSALYTAVALLGIPLAIVLASLLNTPGLKGRSFYRVLYFIPVVTMPAAIALVWTFIYNGDYGVLNQALHLVGIQGTSWLANPSTALMAVAVVGIWATLGTNIVIFVAGLQGIPASLYEAASLDGAGPIRRFFSVTLPLLSPSVFFVSVITVIGALQVFDLLYVMIPTGSPAREATMTIVSLFYQVGFIRNQRGLAAAIALVLMVIILILTAVQFRLQRKWVHYEY
ncbi:sugar ABC transporter permease [Diaminobutyricibacter tongyongensis]|uniref:Sugar ABC transporter permease n=2 Tax=Leifsonia tongyongensis TaxID=1268043 RepID=A0A6L9XVF3_9MICO|nr:sugar ABC transporter permease [Diaminobutyricibacter tongyongensis]NEN05410.1 sugar ABC transporter permease [Diaminobutyricibacter tongyongensis]